MDHMSDFKQTPLKADIAGLEPFEGLHLRRIFVVTEARQAALAVDELLLAGEIGFDTESKPTFLKGQKSEGPHVLQFATLEKAFIFQSHCDASQPAVVELLNIIDPAELRQQGYAFIDAWPIRIGQS